MKKFRYLIIIGLIVIDQLVKYAIRAAYTPGMSTDVIKGIFRITYVQNTGAAFSIFEGQGVFLIAFPLIALGVAVWFMEKHLDAHFTLALALELIVSGGLGNLIDRVFLGFVTDMFDFIIWPVFNVADIAICVGCGVLVLYVFLFDKDSTFNKKKG